MHTDPGNRDADTHTDETSHIRRKGVFSNFSIFFKLMVTSFTLNISLYFQHFTTFYSYTYKPLFLWFLIPFPQLQPRCMRVNDVQQILRPDGEPSQPFCYTRSPLIRRPLRTEHILFRIQIVNSSPFSGQSLHTNDILLTTNPGSTRPQFVQFSL